MYAQKSFIDKILKIGIDACLLKKNTGRELKEAIERVTSGKSYYDLIHTFNVEENKIGQHKLSGREIEIINFLAEGLRVIK